MALICVRIRCCIELGVVLDLIKNTSLGEKSVKMTLKSSSFFFIFGQTQISNHNAKIFYKPVALFLLLYFVLEMAYC